MRSLPVLVAYAVLTVLTVTGANSQTNPDLPGSNVLKYRLAVSLKQLGDEQFLAGDRTGADTSYQQSEAIAKELVPEPPEVLAPLIELVKLETSYRRLLLQRGLHFWDSSATFVIANPKEHLQQMQDYSTKLKALEHEIGGFITSNSSTQITNLKALEQEVDTKFTVETIKEEKAGTIEEFNQTRIAEFRDRIVYIQNREQELAGDAAATSQQLTQLENQNTSIIANAVASQLNLKTDFSTGIQQQLQSNIGSAAQSLLSSNSGTLLSAVQQFSSVANDAVAAYQQIEAVKNKVQEYTDLINASKAQLRAPSVQGLLAIGESVYGHLPSADQQSVANLISQQKPLALLVGITHSNQTARTAVLDYVTSLQVGSNNLQSVINSAVDLQQRDLGGWYARELQTLYVVSQQDLASEQKIVEAALKSFSSEVRQQLPLDVLAKIQSLCNATTNAEVDQCIAQFDSRGLNFKVTADFQLVLDGTGLKLPLNSLLSTLAQVNPAPGAQLVNTARTTLFQLIKGTNQISAFLQVCPDRVLDDQVQKLMPAQNATAAMAAFDQILSKVNSTGQKEIIGQLARVQVGSISLNSILANNPQLAVNNGTARDFIAKFASNHPGQTASSSDAFFQAAIGGALSYAVPAAGLAQAGVKLLSNFYQMDGMIRRIREENDEIRKLTGEEIQIYDMVDESRFNVALAQYDRRIAQTGRQGALLERGLYREELRSRATQMSVDRAKALLRSQFLFYFAERLREEYDALNRSLSLWIGSVNGRERAVEDLVRSDSSDMRLALDPQINLFEWLNRDKESERDDLIGIADHWEKVTQIAADLCEAYACGTSSSTTSSQLQTYTASVSSLSSVDWKLFKQWQQQPNGQPFNLWFSILPGEGIAATHYNARVVDLRLGAKQSDGSVVSLQNFTLSHPGVSYINLPDRIAKDVQAPKDSTSLSLPTSLDLNALRRRWLNSTSYDDKFEGYGVFTNWRLVLNPDALNLSLQDLTLQITYQYENRPASTRSPSISSGLDVGLYGVTVRISPDLLSTIANSDQEIASKLRRWQASGGQDAIPPISITKAEKVKQ